jgi:hydroxymethylglutaryl-CoA lyase
MEPVTLIECPRDAWQGLSRTIPTDAKVRYLRRLVELGFRHIDAVSFVSPRQVPQMADSEAVAEALQRWVPAEAGAPEIIGIVLNEKGLERALAAAGVTTVGYPYSISATFQRANAHMSPAECRPLVARLVRRTRAAGRGLVVYISMAFGNPYGDPWSPDLVVETLAWLSGTGVTTVSLADTVGTATPSQVADLVRVARGAASGIELGVHLHGRREGAAEKAVAAYEAGCRRFDSALTGLGGCPFAGDALVGNLPTEVVVPALGARGADVGLRAESLEAAVALARELSDTYLR